LRETSIETVHAHHSKLAGRLLDGLSTVPGVTVHGPPTNANRTSVISITDASHSMPRRFSMRASHARGARHRRGRRNSSACTGLLNDARRN
jgi:selenocysteine lyase/cysteine desulfurase